MKYMKVSISVGGPHKMLWRAACDQRAMVFPPLIYNINASLNNICLITTKTGCEQTEEKKKKVGFTSFLPRSASSDVLIQCMSTTTHSLLNQTLYWSNVALQIPDALPDDYQWCFYRALNSKPFALKPVTIPLHHGGYIRN